MSKPLEGIKFAATFVDDQTETELISKIRSLGGEFYHKMDSEVRFLVVGKKYTKKYDFALIHGITLISAESFFSLYVSWRSGEDVNFLSDLGKRKLKPFDNELICLSNMDSRQKDGFHELIAAGGGQYSIAFARVNTILVSPQASGRKIDGAKKWGTPVVHPKWISDSMKFGAALNPERYNIEDPNAVMEPPKVIQSSSGVYAAGPTATVAEERAPPVLKRRKGQDLLFNAPLAKRDRASVGPTMASFTEPPLLSSAGNLSESASETKVGIFKGIRFNFEGFDSRQLGILNRAVRSLEGTVDSNDETEYLVVHSGSPGSQKNRGRHMKSVTEWAIERSIYLKRNALDDIWSQPVFAQPAAGFSGLSVCISGFQGIEQRHATLLTKMLGANFLETLKEDRDLLIAASDKAHKVPYAIAWHIPVVNIDWLWQSALAGRALSLANEYILDGKGPRPMPLPKSQQPNRSSIQLQSADSTSINQDSVDSLDPLQENEKQSYDEIDIRYHDDDAAARAQVLMALGEKPLPLPEAEPETRPAAPVRLSTGRRRQQQI